MTFLEVAIIILRQFTRLGRVVNSVNLRLKIEDLRFAESACGGINLIKEIA